MEAQGMQEAYGRVAEVYIDLFASGEREHPGDLALIQRHLGGRDGLFVDLGCGPGHLTRLLGGDGASVLGFDLVEEFLQHARASSCGATFQLASMEALPLRDGSADGILSWYSLIHQEPDVIDDVLTEVRRVLKPGGVLVIGFFVGDVVEPFEHKVTRAFRCSTDALAARMRRAGFAETARAEREERPDRRAHGVLVVTAA